MSSCTYKFKNASGEEVTITGQAEMKAFLANGGLEQLLPGKVLPWRGSAKADDGPKSESPFAAYDDVARTYGYEVREDGAVGSDGKFPGVTIKVKGGRLRVESSSGNLLGSYPAKPESIGRFLESFWYAEKASSDKPAPAESPKVEAKPALSYIQPSKVDTPAQGALANAIEQKSRAWSQVKTLRSRVKDGETNLRVDLLKAEDMWREAKRYEADAREQIEVEANKQGMTTKRDSGPLYEVDQNGDPSPEEAEAVQRGLQGKNPIEAAAWLAENAPPQYATIAAKVHDKLQDLNDSGVRLGMAIINAGDIGESQLIGARGVTIPSYANGRQSITVALNGFDMKGRVGTSYRTALHELVHAATLQPLDRGMKGIGRDHAQAAQDLYAVGDAIIAHMNERVANSRESLTEFEISALQGRSNFTQSPFEMIAWALSSSEAQAYLESIPYKSKTLWTAFVEAVRKVLGLTPKSDTALSEVLRISEILLKPEREGWPGRVPLHGNGHYEIQQPGGGRIFKHPGGRPETNWSDTPSVLRTDVLPDTLTIDGVQRPTKNSKGQPIHPTEEGIRNFWRWFSDSKVVDAEGRPLVVYHGTTSEIEGGFKPGTSEWDAGIFFTSSAEVAGSVYAQGQAAPNEEGIRAALAGMSNDAVEALAEKLRRQNGGFEFWPEDYGPDMDIPYSKQMADYAIYSFDEYEDSPSSALSITARALGVPAKVPASGSNVVAGMMRLRNPLEIDGSRSEFDQEQQAEWMDQAKAGGHDGLIIRHYKDGGFGGPDNFRSAGRHDVFVAFHPEQIKSAVGNAGAFDPSSPDIRFRSDFDDRPARAGWTESRIDRLIGEFAYDFDGTRTKAYAAFVNPDDFLIATTPKSERDKLEAEAKPLDREGLAGETQPIYLRVRETDEDGVFKIVGHEGRHRMMALRDAGYSRVPVALIFPDAVYDASEIEEPYFLAQKFGDGTKAAKGFSARSATPITSGNRAELVEEFSSNASGNNDIRFRNDYPDTQAFREWFGNSKMTNKAGEPLLFMHGSPASFEAFDSSKLGTSSTHMSSGLGHFFTRDRATAEKYADGGNIYTGWLKIEKPYVMMLEEAQAFDDAAESAKRRAELQKQGYDGAVILDDEGKPWATVAFEPWQFKSTDNNGSFDEFDDRMRFRDDPSSMRDATTVPRDQAEEFIRKFVAEYPGAPQIMLADSFYQLPEDIQSDALEQGSGPTRAKGALKNGKAYVVLNTHTSMADLEASVFHEVLGHAGIRKLLGPAFAQELNKMFIGLGGYSKLYQIMSKRGMGRQFEGYYDAVQRAREKNPEVWTEFLASSILTEEVFAHIAEQKNAKALRDRFMALVGMVRDWLRRNGFARLASLGESDIVFLLQRARAGLKNGSGVIRDGVTIGETVIVDAEGRPVAKKGSPDYEMLKAVSERMGLRETNGPTVFSNSLPEEGKPGDDARMDDANDVAGKQAPTPAGDVEGSAQWAYEAYQSGVVHDGWYVHGRAGRGDLNTNNVLQLTKSWDVADQYAGRTGSKWLIRPTGDASELDLSDSDTTDMDRVVSAALDDFDRGRLSWLDDLEGALGRDADESDAEDAVRSEFAPDDIVDTAKAYDNQAMSEWLAYRFDYPSFVKTPDGAVVFSREGIESVRVPNESPASASSDAPTVFRTVAPEQLNAYAQPRGQAAKEVVGNLIAAFREPSSKIFNVLHKTISTPLHKASISKDYDRVFRLAQDYQNDIARFAAGPADAAPRMLPSYDSIRQAFSRLVHGNKYAKFKGAVADAIFEGTLAGEDVTSGRVWTDAELRDRYDMTDDQIGLYREARDAIDASLDSAAAGLAWQAVKKYIPDMKGAVRHEPADAEKIIDAAMRQAEDELREVARYQAEVEKDGAIPKGTAEKTLNKAKSIAEARVAAEGIFARANALKAGGYAPLMRFGKYAVDAVRKLEDGTEERTTFMRFESELEAKTAAQKIRKLHPDAEVKRSIISEEAWKIYKGVDPELVSLFAESLDGVEGLSVKEDVLQEWYRNAVSERSSFKRMIHRKGTDGFDRDITRVLASFITSNSRLAARQFNMGDISEALADMNERKVSGDVLDDATGLKEYIDNPEKPFKAMKGMMFAFFLGGSVASAALNLTQPMMMTFPYLSQYGARKAGAALRGAAAEAAKGSVSDKELGRALSRATKDGIVDPQQIHHLYHESLRSFLAKLPLGEGLQERAQGLMTLWGMMFGATENFNRRLTFIAAYRMAKDDPSMGNPYDFAAKAVEETQGIYNDANIPNWARGNGSFGALGVAAFTFKQYSIGYVELLIRLAKSGKNGRKGAAIMLGTLVLMSGMQGAPGADDLEDVIDTVAQYMGYTGNSRLALRKSLESGLGNVFAQETAKEMAHIIMYGGLSVLPGDLASRTGLGNLFPATAIAKPSEQNRGSQIAEIFGPPLGMANQVLDATLAMESGAGALGVASAFAPVAVRNWIKAYDMASTGQYRDTKGRKVVDVTAGDVALKAIGIQPTVVSDDTKSARLVNLTKQRITQVKSAIGSLKAQGIADRNPEMKARADAMVKEWNEKNPDATIRINDASILKRVKEINTERRARLLKAMPKDFRSTAAESYSE